MTRVLQLGPTIDADLDRKIHRGLIIIILCERSASQSLARAFCGLKVIIVLSHTPNFVRFLHIYNFNIHF